MMEKTLSIYGSHDAGAVFIDKQSTLRILEYERITRQRYAMYSDRFDGSDWEKMGTSLQQRKGFISYIKSLMMYPDVESIIYNELSNTDLDLLREEFPNAVLKQAGHHRSHAACAYFQSPFDDALVISIDGGGWDAGSVSMSKVYLATKNRMNDLNDPKKDLGNPYGLIGCPISEINPGPDSINCSLVYAGKVMGLCAYGNIRADWLHAMRRFYDHKTLRTLGNEIGLELSFNSLSGQNSYDLAATSQAVFEEVAFDLVKSYLSKHLTNVVLTGGCALNVLFNQRLKEHLAITGHDLYVPPNPNDCGLALGQMLNEHPQKLSSVVYNGFELLDKADLDRHIVERGATKISIDEIVDLLSKGKIIGLVEGDSEVGPRALGNRSIICDPSFPGMKDILNTKVKFREWFRPFAPVAILQDAPTYFNNVFESAYMSYAPTVKNEYRDKLVAITHIDGTSRLQTVTEHQHSRFYNILSTMKTREKIPVILNTSFNIKGRPILTTIKDALHVLDNTELDYVIIENYLFSKRG